MSRWDIVVAAEEIRRIVLCFSLESRALDEWVDDYDQQKSRVCGQGLPTKLRDLFFQRCLPIRHHRKGHGSVLRHRHTDEKTCAICSNTAADKTRR